QRSKGCCRRRKSLLAACKQVGLIVVDQVASHGSRAAQLRERIIIGCWRDRAVASVERKHACVGDSERSAKAGRATDSDSASRDHSDAAVLQHGVGYATVGD